MRSLQLGLPFLSTLPTDMAVKVQPRLSFTVDGQAVELEASAVPFAPDRATELALKLSGLPLSGWWAYLPAGLPLRAQGGILAADLKLQFAQPSGEVPSVSLSGQIALRDITALNTANLPLLSWQQLNVRLDAVRPLERQLGFGPVRLEGLQVEVRRDSRGSVRMGTAGAAGRRGAERPGSHCGGAPTPTCHALARERRPDRDRRRAGELARCRGAPQCRMDG